MRGLFILMLFVVLPALEIWLLMHLGSTAGVFPTLALIFTTGALGYSAARSQGFSVLRQLQEDAARGLPPAQHVAEALMVLVGGVLLLTPGLITDVIGFTLVLPWTRRPLAPLLIDQLLPSLGSNVHVSVGGQRYERGPEAPPPPAREAKPPRERSSNPFDHPSF